MNRKIVACFTRRRRTRNCSGDYTAARFREAAVAALAFLKIEQGLVKLGAAEIGPKSFGDINFGIGYLPQEEIADAHFAAGANQQVGIRQSGGVEMLRNHLLIHAS